MNVEAAKRSLLQVLGQPEEQLRVPHFQRAYSWGAEQIDELWDDITVDMAKGHFLGSIVLSAEDPTHPLVIDGQQRLTTLVLLMSVLRDACYERGLAKQVDRITNLLIADKYSDGDGQFRLRTGGANWEVFRDFVLRGPGDPDRKTPVDVTTLPAQVRGHNRPLLDNHKRLRTLLAAQLESLNSDDSRREWLIDADKLFAKNLELVVIRVGDLSDAFLLFETLNDRGMQLSAADLLKNHLLGRIADSEGSEDAEDAAKQWDSMLQTLGAQVDVTRFLRHYLLGASAKVKKNEVFAMFKQRVTTHGARAVFDDLRAAALAYGEFENPQRVSDTATQRVLADLQVLNAVTCYIALLPARRLLSSADFLDFAQLAEVLTYRYSSILGRGTNTLEAKYHEAAKLLLDTNGQELASARAILIAELGTAEDFIREFERQSMGRQYLLKYTLRKLEEPVAKEKQIKAGATVHIEHIMPQSLSDEWLAQLGDDAKRHGEYLNRWGNLTLFLDKFNIPASNKSFDDKRPYYVQSDVALTKELADETSWDFAAIERRQHDLAKRAEKFWNVASEPTTNASSQSPVETFKVEAGQYWQWVEPLVVETSAEDIAQLAAGLPRHLENHPSHGDHARKLEQRLLGMVERWTTLDAGRRSVVRAAVAYFLSTDDAVPDDAPNGLDDDEAIVTAAEIALKGS